MLKKVMSFLVILAIITCTYSAASAQTCASAISDPRALEGVVRELEQRGTDRALVEMVSGGVKSAHVSDLTGAAVENGRIVLFFKDNGINARGLYMEPDLVRHMDAVSENITPGETSAYEAGNEIGLDRLRELFGNSDKTIIAAVLDTGVDITRPEFKGRIVSPYDAAVGGGNPQDTIGHGTHIAGIIAANTPENVKIMPVKVFSEEGDAPDSTIVKGIDYAVKHGANIINLSLGGYGTTSYLEKAIDYAYSSGVTIIASAGNEAADMSHDYPAAFPKAITVGATGENGDLLYFSNTGDAIDVCAPGEKITSTVPGGGAESKSGTSMAAPLVSSAAALLLLEDSERTPAEIEKIIRSNTVDLGVPGKDKLFGFGEVSFGNYKSDPDFYMVENAREKKPAEEKFTMNLSWFSAGSVNRLEIFIDGAKVREVQNSVSGENRISLDIRNLAVGSHKLEIRPVLADGAPPIPYKRDFMIPDYNVRVRVYSSDNTLMPNPSINVIGFSGEDKVAGRLDVSPVVSDGVWKANLDYEKLYAIYDKIRCAVDPATGGFQGVIPLYLRTTGTTGEKIFEPSECLVLGLTSDDPIPGCTVETHLLGQSLSGFNSSQAWGAGAYAADIGAEDIGFTKVEDDGGKTEYAGLLYYDAADLWLDVYSYGVENPAQAGLYTDAWYYSGKIGEADSIINLSSSKQVGVSMATKMAVKEPPEYMLLNIPTGDSIRNTMQGSSGSVGVKPGVYNLFFLLERALKDGKVAQDGFFTSFYGKEGGARLDYSFGGSLQNRFIYDSTSGMILHRWVDGYGNGYTVAVSGPGGSDFCTPVLVLTDQNGRGFNVQGSEIMDAGDFIHGYSLNGVPDGTYGIEFVNENEYLAYPVQEDQKPVTITILNGKIGIRGNTPPTVFSNYTSYIQPGELFVYDLAEEFSDKEQKELVYASTAGWIVGGMFFYRDLIGEDAKITITAYDGAGASASFTHTIRVSDKIAAEEGYIPSPDIDSLGAASWALPFVRNAIEADIVPVDLLDSYQSYITRLEFSSLIVRMAEKLTGPITKSPGVSFYDTRDENVIKAASAKFLAGSNGYFSPDEDLSRQQFCVIVYQAVKSIRPDLTMQTFAPSGFRDSNRIAPWAKDAVDFCAARNLIVGSGGILEPTGKLSREQAILMLYKAYAMCRR